MDSLKSFFSASYKRTLTLVILLIILAVLPLAVIVSQQQQDLRQRAVNETQTCTVTINNLRQQIGLNSTNLGLIEYIYIKITDANTGRVIYPEVEVLYNEDPIKTPSNVPDTYTIEEYSPYLNEAPTISIRYQKLGSTEVILNNIQGDHKCSGPTSTPSPTSAPTPPIATLTPTPADAGRGGQPPSSGPIEILDVSINSFSVPQDGSELSVGSRLAYDVSINKWESSPLSLSLNCTYKGPQEVTLKSEPLQPLPEGKRNWTIKEMAFEIPESFSRLGYEGVYHATTCTMQIHSPGNFAPITPFSFVDKINKNFYFRIFGPPIPTSTSTPTRTPTPTTVPAQPTAAKTPVPTQVVLNCPLNSPGNTVYKTKGDANCDGKVNREDYLTWINEAKGLSTNKFADFNSDNTVNRDDYLIWINGAKDGQIPH